MGKLEAGDKLPELKKEPVTKEQLKLYAKASGDFNPIHTDDEAARKAGLDGVIAHGMLTMAYMGEFLYQTLYYLGWNEGKISKMNCRFKAMTFPGDEITVSGTVKTSEDGIINCLITARNQKGGLTANGTATLSKN